MIRVVGPSDAVVRASKSNKLRWRWVFLVVMPFDGMVKVSVTTKMPEVSKAIELAEAKLNDRHIKLGVTTQPRSPILLMSCTMYRLAPNRNKAKRPWFSRGLRA